MIAPRPADLDHPDPALIAEAGRLMRDGGIVAHPADTIYGLAAAARHPGALEHLRRLKGRADERPFIVLIDEPGRLEQLVHSVRRYAVPWISRLWPAPLTLIFPARPDAPGRAADGSLAVRCPAQPLTRALVREVAGVMASTSANRTGEPPVVSAAAAIALFGGGAEGLSLAIDPLDPKGTGAVASTIVDCRGEAPVVVRAGAVAAERLGLPG
jgi:L-threonylcarbamoyladenylate synthase